MGGDGLTLAVRVGRDQDAVSLFCGRLEFLDDRGFALDLDVLGFKVLLDVHAQLALGQVHDMAY